MLEEHTINLINADLDGELGADERKDLDAILESSAEARTMRSELLRLNNLLDSQPKQAPPQGLSQKIIDQMAPSRTPTFSLSGLFASFQPATAGMAFAAGLLMTVGFYELSPGSRSADDAASMVGTMVASAPGSHQLMKNDIFLKGDGFSGTVSLREKEGVHILNFDLDSRESTQVDVDLASTGLSFGGFAEVQGDADKVIDSVAISGGALRVVNQGRQQFAVFLRKNSADQAVQTELITIWFSSERHPQDEAVSAIN